MFINNFDPVAINFFSLEIRWYSLSYIFGILAGWVLAKSFFIQASYKTFNSNGNEFLTQRDSYGNITYFVSTEIDQKDHLISMGILYKIRENIYAKLHHNWWGSKFADQPNYKYNRLILILSVEL